MPFLKVHREIYWVNSRLCFQIKHYGLCNVGDSAGFKTFKIPVLTFTYLQYATFADIVMRHRIF